MEAGVLNHFFTILMYGLTLYFVVDIFYRKKTPNTLVIPETTDGRLVLIKNASKEKWEVIKEIVKEPFNSGSEHMANLSKESHWTWSVELLSYIGTIHSEENQLFIFGAKISDLKDLGNSNQSNIELQDFSRDEVRAMIQSGQITDAASLAALIFK